MRIYCFQHRVFWYVPHFADALARNTYLSSWLSVWPSADSVEKYLLLFLVALLLIPLCWKQANPVRELKRKLIIAIVGVTVLLMVAVI